MTCSICRQKPALSQTTMCRECRDREMEHVSNEELEAANDMFEKYAARNKNRAHETTEKFRGALIEDISHDHPEVVTIQTSKGNIKFEIMTVGDVRTIQVSF